jgi:hypothetical protein
MGSEIDLIALAAGWRLARRAGLKTGEQAAREARARQRTLKGPVSLTIGRSKISGRLRTAAGAPLRSCAISTTRGDPIVRPMLATLMRASCAPR